MVAIIYSFLHDKLYTWVIRNSTQGQEESVLFSLGSKRKRTKSPYKDDIAT